MILFKPEHVPLILEGFEVHGYRYFKRETRRFWKAPRAKVGAVHQARTNMPWQDEAGHFTNIAIEAVYEQALLKMTEQNVYAEGYRTFDEYMAALERINRREVSRYEVPFVVRFEPVQPFTKQSDPYTDAEVTP